MNTRISIISAITIGLLTLSSSFAQKRFDKWEKNIAAFESADKKNPPAKNSVLFVGSSSIRMWDLEKFFPDLKTINRGFGGSTIADSIHFFDRIIQPYQPKVIVVYAGDNDMAKKPKGMTPEEVFADFKTLAGKVKSSLPNSRLIYIAIKPSIKRKNLWPGMDRANGLIEGFCAKQDNMDFADIASPMLDNPDKTLSPDLFKKDGLHLTDKGYEMWKSVLLPLIEKGQ